MNRDASPAIEFSGVTFSYPSRPPSLRDLDLRIERGMRTAILGPNGAGKTTLLLHCNGTLRPDRGSISVCGQCLRYDRNSLREVRRRIGLVFQRSDSQLIAPTVYQDVAFGPVNLGMREEAVKEAVEKALAAVGLQGYERRVPHRLSEGEKKRVAIAGVLAMGPEILILDEPTASLDPQGAAEVIDLLEELHEGGKTIIIATHDVEFALGWAEEVILLAGGEKIFQGPSPSILADPQLMRRAHLRMPPLAELVQGLSERNIIPKEVFWRGVPAILEAIAERVERMGEGRRGIIYLADVSNGIGSSLERLLNSGDIMHTGAMGTFAKMEAEKRGISVEFTHGVIDKCLLRAMMGENSLILTSGGMVNRVRERVSGFSSAYRMKIPLQELSSGMQMHE